MFAKDYKSPTNLVIYTNTSLSHGAFKFFILILRERGNAFTLNRIPKCLCVGLGEICDEDGWSVKTRDFMNEWKSSKEISIVKLKCDFESLEKSS